MVVYNYSGKEINAKIVYYGPALSGKTTNLEWIYSKIPLEYSGKMISLRTQTDRTIFFDFLPLELGLIDGFKTRFMLYTVPGQVYYNATRKMVLKGADGVVFVADSEEGRMADNLESLQNLRENMVEIGLDPDTIPIVLQWNKRDLPETMDVAQLERQLNPEGHPSFEACALTGEGVYETLHQISRMIYRKLAIEENAEVESTPTTDLLHEDSLFGEDIAARLREVDRPDPTLLDPVSLAEEDAPARRDGDVLDAILGTFQSAPEESEAVQEAAEETVEETTAAVPPVAAVPPQDEEEEEVYATVSARPVSEAGRIPESEPGGPKIMSHAPTPPDPPSRPTPPARDPSDDVFVSDLVDNVFSPAGPQEDTPTEREEDHTFGSSFGRMVDLGEQEAPPAAPAEEDFELPEDLLSSGVYPPLPEEDEGEEALELITDPRKLPGERSSGTAPVSSSDYSTGSFKPLSGATRTLEVPVTVDAEALEDGKTIRIVLNLQMRR